jgi:hypothetical protein
MRGRPDLQMTMLTTVSMEAMVPADHPLRRMSAPGSQAISARGRRRHSSWTRPARTSTASSSCAWVRCRVTAGHPASRQPSGLSLKWLGDQPESEDEPRTV